jgi:hypothetical protein
MLIQWAEEKEELGTAKRQMLSLQQRAAMMASLLGTIGSAYMFVRMTQFRQHQTGLWLRNAQLRVQTATEKYQAALQKEGPLSEQATKAQRELTIAKNYSERAQAMADKVQMQQWLVIFPMSMSVMGSLQSAYSGLTMSQQRAASTPEPATPGPAEAAPAYEADNPKAYPKSPVAHIEAVWTVPIVLSLIASISSAGAMMLSQHIQASENRAQAEVAETIDVNIPSGMTTNQAAEYVAARVGI